MAEPVTYPTDQAICRLLAGEALPTATVAHRLALPDRTARHRLRQLRRAGLVITGPDGLHRLAAGASPALAGPAPALAAASDAEGQRPSDAGSWGSGTLAALAALGLAVIGVVGVALLAHGTGRPVPPPAATPPAWHPGGSSEGIGWQQW